MSGLVVHKMAEIRVFLFSKKKKLKLEYSTGE